MTSSPPDPTASYLVDTEVVAAAAAPVVAWFEWYATSGDQPVTPNDMRELFAADEQLAPLARLGGPVGAAIEIILDGGLGHATDTLLDALDTLDTFVHPDRPPDQAPWHLHPHPAHRSVRPEPNPGYTTLTLPGID